jgi:hypothetical protein
MANIRAIVSTGSSAQPDGPIGGASLHSFAQRCAASIMRSRDNFAKACADDCATAA